MMKHIKKALSMLLVLCMVLSFVPMSASAEGEEVMTTSLTMGTKPADGTTTGNPFVKGTGGSNSFRIPAMVTLNDGTLVAAADARWNTTYDGGGLDTIVSYSTDNGANWNYTFANYLGDNGNTYNGSGSTAFIDPALATDGSTVYMLCDLYPYGVALNGSGNTAPSTAVGFNSDGTLKLAASGSSTYNYYLKDGQIYDSSNNVISGYTVDAYFNITGNGYDTNLFFSDSPYQVVRTGYLYLTSSSDGGKTWSAPTLIPNVKTSSEQVCLVGPGRGLVTYVNNKQTIVFPVYSYNGSSSSQQMGFIYSSDGGATWTRSANFTGDSWSSESAAVELEDGTLRFFYRNGNSKLYYADYTWDNGWSSAVNTGIATNSNTQISAISLQNTVDGKQVILVSCPTGSNSNGSADSSASARLNGKIFVGYVNSDNTMSWQSDKAVSVTSNNSQFMYSCLTALTDTEGNETGKVAILYENKESAWGTGDNCYYTMDFQTYDLGLTFDPIENEDIYVDNGEDDTGITINFGSAERDEVTITKQTDVPALADKTYVAYDISVTGFSGTATVTIPLKGALKGNNLYAVYVDDDGKIAETIQGDYDAEADTFTFTTSHFSTYAVVQGTTKDIILTVGEEQPVKDETGNYESSYTGEGLNTSIATVTVKGATTEGTPAVPESTTKKTSLSAGTYIIGNGTQWLTLSGNTLGYTTEASQATQWTVAASGSSWTIKSGNYYLYHSTNSASLSASTTSSTWNYGSNTGFYYTYRSGRNNYTAYLRWSGTAWQASTTKSNYGAAYTYTPGQDAVEGTAYTNITFNGISAGKTSVTVGGTLYNITVNRKKQDVSLSVGGTAAYTDSSSNVTVADSTVASATLSNGTLTIKGLKDGTTTVTTDTTVYTVTVSEGTPISIKENETTTISVTLENGQTVEWSSADSSYVGVAGKYDTTAGAYTNEAILAGQNVTSSPVVVTATIKDAGGNVVGTQKWLVTVTEGDADTNTSSKGIYFNISTIENCTVYYSINGGELIPVNGTGVTTGNWTGNGTYKGHFNIMFFAAPDEGYALTYMSISGSADQYYTLSNGNPDGTGSDAWPFTNANASTIPSSSSDSAWKTVNGSLHGFRWALLEGNMTIDQMKVLFSNAIALGCDGATTITKNGSEGMGSASSPTVCKFVAQKLPTVEKTIKSITHDGTETAYTDGMKVELGDTINYRVVVTRYATNATYGTITYDNEKLTDALTNNNGISNPDMGTSTTSDKTYPYPTSLTVTMDNYANVVKDGKITNTADFSYSYSSQYSAGSLTSEASAVADITMKQPEYVIDFGLPVTINLATELGGATISSGTAKYGSITASGTSFTYTPNQTLKDVDYVTLTLANGQSYGVTIYPATTVYYEEGFATLTGFTGGSKGSGTQVTQIAGQSTDEYGYDTAYGNVLGLSGNTQATSSAKGDKAEFTFTGTGVDIDANCTPRTGNLMIQVKNSAGSTVKILQVNTALLAGNSDATNFQNVTGYNVPVASISGLAHDNYTVTITNVSTEEGKTTVNLDGFRVYGTLADQKNSVYMADLEDNPTFIEVRDEVLAGLRVTSDGSGQVNAALPDDQDTTVAVVASSDKYTKENVDDLLKNGPKNEIYLQPEQALVLKITTAREVQIGLKALNAETKYTVNGGSEQTLKSSTDMFYTVLNQGSSGEQTITITNKGDGILAITKLKICDDPNATLCELTEDDLTQALIDLGLIEKPDKPEDPFRYHDMPEKNDQNSWYFDPVYNVHDHNLMVGDSNNNFRPFDKLTREEAAVIMVAAAGIDANEYEDTPCAFSDVSGWATKYIVAAYENQLVAGVGNGKYAPKANVTREEFVTMLERVVGIDATDYKDQPCTFKDVPEGNWCEMYVVAAKENQLVSGYPDGTFGYKKPVTRAEAAVILSAALARFELGK